MAVERVLRLSAAVLAAIASAQALAAPLVISEFRVRGPNGANDEFIEIYNETAADHTVSASGTGTGYGIAASDGTVRGTIPNGTVIPAHGHYLIVNSVGYSLASYPAGNGTTATGDATYTTDIPDNAGIALFTTNVPGEFALATRMDAIGSTSEANTLYKEATGYPALTPFSIDYAFHRDECGKDGSITTFGNCPAAGTIVDSNNNAADLVFVDTNGTSAGAGQRLGAPGPENSSSPITNGSNMDANLLDTCVAQASPPNIVRDFTSDPPNNSTFGTLDIRYTFVNNTGQNLTRLRFRVIDLTTFPAPSGIADLRPRTSTAVVVTVDRPPCGSGTSNVTVQGTTLEQPPSQPNGGGFNSSMSAGVVTLATPIANGASVDLRFLLGIQQNGYYKLGIVPEGLPALGFTGEGVEIEGCTLDCPSVLSINRVNATPTSATTVDYTVTFNTSVTGVDVTDFVLTNTGISGASVTGVTGSNATYTVTVNTGTGSGTLRLDLNDDNSIVSGSAALGGPSVDDGDFVGQVYDIDKTGPAVTLNQDGAQADPTATSPINFAVIFDEAVTGFDATDVTVGGTALPTSAVVTGSGTTYNVAVSGMTANGTVTASVNAGAVLDALNNPSSASTSADDTVNFTGADATIPTVTIDQDAGQADPTATSPILFTVVFSESVTGFDSSDIVLGGTAGATTAVVSGGPTIYTVTVSGMTTNGTVTASINAGAATDGTNLSQASTSTDNTVTFNGFDVTAPTVTVEQAVGQADPAVSPTITYTVTFSEPVTGFDSSDITIGGTAGATTAVVTGGPTVYTVTVSGMTQDGTVIVSIAAGVAIDGAGNANTASTSTDNVVVFAGFGAMVPVQLPMLSWQMLAFLAGLLGVLGSVARRRGLMRF
ncbi:beta strand repeat-containing protein [Tahibacter amnicola]|uniref:Ig-like domain-containing protein n=1 Tax=Tahibacter amnicola TaxID=2976241 RepID=A0ABY6BA64_9GAMM|nr:Ig-like domain-containing protein [Tahibacter amnicola]UXI66549.1 Ig-like domain-containing protein [Tahibacter amnicola]